MITSITTTGDTWFAPKYTVSQPAKVAGDKPATVKRIRRRGDSYLVVFNGAGGHIVMVGAEFVESVEDDPSVGSAPVRFFQPAVHTHDGRIHPGQVIQLDSDAPAIRFFRVHAAPVDAHVNPAAIAPGRRSGDVEGYLLTGELAFDHGEGGQHDWRPHPVTARPHEPRPAALVWFTDWDSPDYDRFTAVYYGDPGEDLGSFVDDLLVSLAPVQP